jgi:4-hydroxybenzoate polyprenyltransferase
MSYLRLMRAHRPIPILLILWPTYWGLFLSGAGVSLKNFLIFTIGVILMRSAGCVINDYFDRNFDPKVARTKTRPLAEGSRSSREALGLFVLLLVLAASLLFFLHPLTIALSFVGLALTMLYPLAKRVTHFPQAVLGLAFNFGLIMGYAEVNQHLGLETWVWYAFALIWTLIYDTEYALVDREDDLKIGVKSTAVFWGDRTAVFISVLSCIMMVFLIYQWACFPTLWRGILVVAIGIFLGVQAGMLARYQDKISFRLFNQHHWLGLAVLLFIIAK